MCLDGSAPGYFIGKGSGSSANKWILHQEGGGWCYDTADCYNRSKTDLGSSNYWKDTITLGGIFSDKESVNGQFYNWNVVFMGYCDGGSFAGYRFVTSIFNKKAQNILLFCPFRKDPVEVNGTNLYFRYIIIIQNYIAVI